MAYPLTPEQRDDLQHLQYWSPAAAAYAEQLLASLNAQVLPYPRQNIDSLLVGLNAVVSGQAHARERLAASLAYLAQQGAFTSDQRAALLDQLQALPPVAEGWQ